MTDSAIKRALYRGEFTSEKAIGEIRATLQEIEEAVGKYANSLLTTDRHANDVALFTNDELYNLSNCWNESWEELYQLYSAGEEKEIFETFENCAQFTKFNYSNGYSVKKLLSLRMEIENEDKGSLTTPVEENLNFTTEGMIREKLLEGRISNECALLEAEASCRTIDEAVKSSLNQKYLKEAESERKSFHDFLVSDAQIEESLAPPRESTNDNEQEEIELPDLDDRENLDLFYSYRLYRITTQMVWNNFHDEDLIHDYSILIGRTKFSLNEVMLLRQLIQELQKEIALARGINAGSAPKERKGKSASEIRMALIRREYSIEDGLREVLATIMDIDEEFMEAYKKGYSGGYNSVDRYWGIVQRVRGNWPKDEVDDICDEGSHEQIRIEIKRMHYTLEEIIELKELEEELRTKLSNYKKLQQAEPAKPEIPNPEITLKGKAVAFEQKQLQENTQEPIPEQLREGIKTNYLIPRPDGNYDLHGISTANFFRFLLDEGLPMDSWHVFVGKLYKKGKVVKHVDQILSDVKGGRAGKKRN